MCKPLDGPEFWIWKKYNLVDDGMFKMMNYLSFGLKYSLRHSYSRKSELVLILTQIINDKNQLFLIQLIFWCSNQRFLKILWDLYPNPSYFRNFIWAIKIKNKLKKMFWTRRCKIQNYQLWWISIISNWGSYSGTKAIYQNTLRT